MLKNKIINLGSSVNIIWEDIYGHMMSMRIFTLIMNKIFIRVPRIMRKAVMSLT